MCPFGVSPTDYSTPEEAEHAQAHGCIICILNEVLHFVSHIMDDSVNHHEDSDEFTDRSSIRACLPPLTRFDVWLHVTHSEARSTLTAKHILGTESFTLTCFTPTAFPYPLLLATGKMKPHVES